MIIIADSGSTKTHWCRVDENGVRNLETQGLNPRFTDSLTRLTEIRHARKALGSPDQVFFYGSGCGTEEMQMSIVSELLIVFLHAECVCEGDLLGACRATCGNNEGMVGILGTGSNLCYYDGKQIVRQRVSTGYILGDEGSGNHIGKRLLKDYLEERMPMNVRNMFYDDYRLTNAQILDQLYLQPFPNRFLATFASFAAQHQEDEYVASVLHDCFSAFFEQLDYFGRHRYTPLNLVGGLVHSFLPTLHQVAERHCVTLGTLMPDPMEGLIRFHDIHC